MNKENITHLLSLLSAIQKTQFYQSDVQFKQVIIEAIDSLNKGDNPEVSMVRLAPFLDRYLISNPCQELIDLQLFLLKGTNKYRGIINMTGWVH
ncbi:hypothetical protein BI362_11105 [Streptococcus parauberis]|uniref:Bacteriocin immunity protein n=1 Tax=Streptococcus parauberis TaxID=1348 RepID=A0AAE4HZA2_9STRE|nr:hypothetical protein [Streptococcus parauberis]MDT2732728.1 hypothetical protein [Streptococcus parauberis]OHY29310.1 hypothetical protein BI362_11105 [Streptococcus parauberis]